MRPDAVPSVPVGDVPDGGVLLDVREGDEWTAGHAPQAVHLPMGEVTQRLSEIPDGDTVHVVCRSGGRSAQVTAYLNQAGWDAVNVDGGMQAWAAEGLPMEAPAGSPQVI